VPLASVTGFPAKEQHNSSPIKSRRHETDTTISRPDGGPRESCVVGSIAILRLPCDGLRIPLLRKLPEDGSCLPR